MIDYFKRPDSNVEALVRRIKGNYRRQFVGGALDNDGAGSIPPGWLDHDLSAFLKDFLGLAQENIKTLFHRVFSFQIWPKPVWNHGLIFASTFLTFFPSLTYS